MSLLPSIFNGLSSSSPRSLTVSSSSLILLTHSHTAPWLSFLHSMLLSFITPPSIGTKAVKPTTPPTIVCVCLLYRPQDFAPKELLGGNGNASMNIVDWTAKVPGYDEELDVEALESEVLKRVEEAQGPVILMIDSPDTLCEDIGSPSKSYALLKRFLTHLASHSSQSRLILPLHPSSLLIPLLLAPGFAPSLTHLTLHPPQLLTHLSTSYLTLPPPHSHPTKFWPLWTGLTTRDEGERLVWGADGEGWGEGGEVVVEVVVRGSGGGGRRGVERCIEGWKIGGPCKVEELEDVKGWKKGAVQQPTDDVPDPTQNLQFNLSLTEKQQQSRAQVPLPYAHEGQPTMTTPMSGSILYDPDSADDIDEDDPDEDLDI